MKKRLFYIFCGFLIFILIAMSVYADGGQRTEEISLGDKIIFDLVKVEGQWETLIFAYYNETKGWITVSEPWRENQLRLPEKVTADRIRISGNFTVMPVFELCDRQERTAQTLFENGDIIFEGDTAQPESMFDGKKETFGELYNSGRISFSIDNPAELEFFTVIFAPGGWTAKNYGLFSGETELGSVDFEAMGYGLGSAFGAGNVIRIFVEHTLEAKEKLSGGLRVEFGPSFRTENHNLRIAELMICINVTVWQGEPSSGGTPPGSVQDRLLKDLDWIYQYYSAGNRNYTAVYEQGRKEIKQAHTEEEMTRAYENAVNMMASLEAQGAQTGERCLENKTDWKPFLDACSPYWDTLPKEGEAAPFTLSKSTAVRVMATEESLRFEFGTAGRVQTSRMKADQTGYLDLKLRGKINGGNIRMDLYQGELAGAVRTSEGRIGLRQFISATVPDLFVIEIQPEAGESGFDILLTDGREQARVTEDGVLLLKGQIAGDMYTTACLMAEERGRKVIYCAVKKEFSESEAAHLVREASKRSVYNWIEENRMWWRQRWEGEFFFIPDGTLANARWLSCYGSTGREEDAQAQDLIDGMIRLENGVLELFAQTPWMDAAFFERQAGTLEVSGIKRRGECALIQITAEKNDVYFIKPGMTGVIRTYGKKNYKLLPKPEIQEGVFGIELQKGETVILYSGDTLPELSVQYIPAVGSRWGIHGSGTEIFMENRSFEAVNHNTQTKRSGQEFVFHAEFFNSTGQQREFVLIASVYEGAVLREVRFFPQTVPEHVFCFSASAEMTMPSGCKSKLFIWESATGLMPLDRPVEAPPLV